MYDIKVINNNSEETLMDVRIPELSVINPSIKEDINKVPSFSFDLPVTNPQYAVLKKLESEIVVSDLDSDEEIFRGRCLDDESDYVNTKSVSCEGILAYLLDVQYPPYVHTGSPAQFLNDLLNYYNSRVAEKQKIYVGTVTVTDPNDYIRRESENYDSIYNVIQDKLVSLLGGWLRLRRVNNTNYLDYLADYEESDQVIRFGENLLDLTKYAKAETIKTVIIPLGAKDEDTGQYVDITSVNGGVNYIKDDNLVQQYGWIEAVVNWDDVTLPDNLLKKAQDYLRDCKNMQISIELSAVDARLLGADVARIHPGMMVRVISPPHHLDDMFLCSSKTTDLLDPSKDKIVLGNQMETFTETMSREQKATTEKINAGDSALSDEIKGAKDEFKESLEKASGLYETKVTQPDGSVITYYHDKKNLEDSQIRMVFNSAGFAMTADGGENWYGMQVNGKMITDILNATGINAEWIRTGKIYSADYVEGKSGIVYDLDNSEINAYYQNPSNGHYYRLQLLDSQIQFQDLTDKNVFSNLNLGSLSINNATQGWAALLMAGYLQLAPYGNSGFENQGLKIGQGTIDIPKDYRIAITDESAGTYSTTKTGRAEFSDGSYLEFKNGFLVGGQTADGTNI